MLTEQKLRYIALRRAGVEKKQAAIGAKYSAKTASQIASRLERDPEIAQAIALGEGQTLISPQLAEAVQKLSERNPPAKPPEGERPEPESILDLQEFDDPMDYLTASMNDKTLSKAMRHDAAKALMPFKHAKKGEVGKKAEKEGAARETQSKTSFRPRMVK